jgi:hypothetical protein
MCCKSYVLYLCSKVVDRDIRGSEDEADDLSEEDDQTIASSDEASIEED